MEEEVETISMGDAEKEAVEELKRRTLPDVSPKTLEDELLFYRFCKARNFNISQAESMLRKHIAWRKEFKIDEMLSSYKPPEMLAKNPPTSFLCFTKDGCVVRYVDCEKADLKELLRLLTKVDMMKYFMYFVEEDGLRVVNHHKKPEYPVLFYMPIFDLENFSYANSTSFKALQCLMYITKSYMDNYPEKMKYAFFINDSSKLRSKLKQVVIYAAPSYLNWMFAAFKNILPSTVKQKIRVYGTDGWKCDLLELVDAEDVPTFLGGSKTDPDGNPLCRTFVKCGEPIPENYLKGQEKSQLAASKDSEKLTIRPLSKEEVRFEVKEENSVIEWEFEVKTGDIDYCWCLQDWNSREPQPIELVPKHRTDTFNQKGVLICEKVGTYVLVFDNSYSRVHQKEVHYRAKVRVPSEKS